MQLNQISRNTEITIAMHHSYNTLKFTCYNLYDVALKFVRFLALYKIKPNTPPLVSIPENFFEFHSSERTSQAKNLLC